MHLDISNRGKTPTVHLYGSIGRQPRNLTEDGIQNFLRAFRAFNTSGDMSLYGEVGEYVGIDPTLFARELMSLGTIDTLNLFVNSVGGSVFDGMAIYSILQRHPASKVVTVDGLAASIAAVVCMAGDEINMNESAMMMIHDAFCVSVGRADDHRKSADMLDDVTDTIAGVFAARSGQSKSVIRTWMADETYFNAADAVQAGLATSVIPLKRFGNASLADRAAVVGRRLALLDSHRQQASSSTAGVAARLRELQGHN